MSSNVDLLKRLKSACGSKWISGGHTNSYKDTCISYFSDPGSDKITLKSFTAGCNSIVYEFSVEECKSVFDLINSICYIDCKVDTNDITSDSTNDITSDSTNDINNDSTNDITSDSTNDITSDSTNDSTNDITSDITSDIKVDSSDISYDEFSRKFQPLLSNFRRKIVSKLFDSLDTSKPLDGSKPVITVADIQLPTCVSDSPIEDINRQNAINLEKLMKHILTVFGNRNLNKVFDDKANEITKNCKYDRTLNVTDTKNTDTKNTTVTSVESLPGVGGVSNEILLDFMKYVVLNENEITASLNTNPKEKFDITDADTITYTEFINYYSDMSLRFDKNQDKEFEAFVTDEWSHARIFA